MSLRWWISFIFILLTGIRLFSQSPPSNVSENDSSKERDKKNIIIDSTKNQEFKKIDKLKTKTHIKNGKEKDRKNSELDKNVMYVTSPYLVDHKLFTRKKVINLYFDEYKPVIGYFDEVKDNNKYTLFLNIRKANETVRVKILIDGSKPKANRLFMDYPEYKQPVNGKLFFTLRFMKKKEIYLYQH